MKNIYFDSEISCKAGESFQTVYRPTWRSSQPTGAPQVDEQRDQSPWSMSSGQTWDDQNQKTLLQVPWDIGNETAPLRKGGGFGWGQGQDKGLWRWLYITTRWSMPWRLKMKRAMDSSPMLKKQYCAEWYETCLREEPLTSLSRTRWTERPAGGVPGWSENILASKTKQQLWGILGLIWGLWF